MSFYTKPVCIGVRNHIISLPESDRWAVQTRCGERVLFCLCSLSSKQLAFGRKSYPQTFQWIFDPPQAEKFWRYIGEYTESNAPPLKNNPTCVGGGGQLKKKHWFIDQINKNRSGGDPLPPAPHTGTQKPLGLWVTLKLGSLLGGKRKFNT